jgi:hypothetical protein
MTVRLTVCRSCQAPIHWAVTAEGKGMPLDPDPDPAGNVRLTGRMGRTRSGGQAPECEVVTGGQAALFPDMAEDRWRPHWASCPHAESWRRHGA